MRCVVSGFVFVMALVLWGVVGSVSAADTTQIYLPQVVYLQPSDTDMVIALTNQERLQVGCAALTVNDQLVAAAQRHSDDMASHQFMDHTGSDGSSPWDRIQAAGYQFSWASENIAAGYPSAQAVTNGWMGSSGHRRNILNCTYHEIGVAVAYAADGTAYWTQDFGAR